MAIRYSGDVELRIQYGGAGWLQPMAYGRTDWFPPSRRIRNKLSPSTAKLSGRAAVRKQQDFRREPYFSPQGEGFYFTTIRAPRIRSEAVLSLREVGLSPSLTRNQAIESKNYDTAALALLKWAELNLGKLPVELDSRDRIIIRRVFQSPCPVR